MHSVIEDTTTIVETSNPICIGMNSHDGSGNPFDGYIDEFRWTKGAVNHTSNFTPPTSAYSTDSNTKLLLHMDGTTTSFVDSSVTPTTNFNFTGDFTLEAWVSWNASGGHADPSIITNGNGKGMYIDGLAGVRFNSNSGSAKGGTTQVPRDNTWHHIAVSRASGVFRFFMDGTHDSDSNFDENNAPGGLHTYNMADTNMSIGILGSDGSSNPFAGYMDDVRISDIARYTADFTPSTTEFNTSTVGYPINETASIVPAFASLDDVTNWSALDDITSTETTNSQTIKHVVIHGPVGMTAYNDTDTVVTTYIPGSTNANDFTYTTEANYQQQEWTNANQSTSQITVSATEAIDVSITNGSSAAGFGQNSAKAWRSQSFTVGATGILSKVSVELQKNGSPTDNIEVSIRAVSGDTPTGSDLTDVVTLAMSNLTTSNVFYDFVFSSPINVTASQKYAIVYKRSGAYNGSNYPITLRITQLLH